MCRLSDVDVDNRAGAGASKAPTAGHGQDPEGGPSDKKRKRDKKRKHAGGEPATCRHLCVPWIPTVRFAHNEG